MTNRTYHADAHTTFDKAMAEFNASGLKSFDVWLNQERVEWKFKIGDFLQHHVNTYSVFVVIDIDDKYMYIKGINSYGNFVEWDKQTVYNRKYPDDRSVFICTKCDQDAYTKIY